MTTPLISTILPMFRPSRSCVFCIRLLGYGFEKGNPARTGPGERPESSEAAPTTPMQRDQTEHLTARAPGRLCSRAMSPILPEVCHRTRQQVSLRLDSELSELEEALVAAHLATVRGLLGRSPGPRDDDGHTARGPARRAVRAVSASASAARASAWLVRARLPRRQSPRLSRRRVRRPPLLAGPDLGLRHPERARTHDPEGTADAKRWTTPTVRPLQQGPSGVWRPPRMRP